MVLLAHALSLALALVPAASTPSGQDAAAPDRGLRRVDPRWHALVHATLVPAPGELVEDATIVLRDGVVQEVRSGGAPPDGARVWDLEGRRVYAGLVEPYLPVEVPAPPATGTGRHWSANVVPQRSALDGDGPDGKTREALRALGFTAALAVPDDGVLRGLGAVVALGEPADDAAAATAKVLASDVAQVFTFQRSRVDWGAEVQDPAYPTSEMGAIALVRQTLLDADWYADAWRAYERDPARSEPPAIDDALAALARREVPLLFESRDELQVLRAARLAEELRRPLLAVGSGTELRRLEALRAAGVPLLVPVDFPEAPEVATRAAAEEVSLRRLQTWEQAPTNLRRLDAAGLRVALTTHGLESRGDFLANVRAAIEHGLPEERALSMLTTVPAELLGLGGRLGRVAPGALANLVVVEGGTLFDEDAEVREVWVGGRRYEVSAPEPTAPLGAWELGEVAGLGGAIAELLVLEEGGKGHLVSGEEEIPLRAVAVDDGRVSFLLDGPEAGLAGVYSFSAAVEGDHLHGRFFGPDGARGAWSAARTTAPGEDVNGDADEEDDGADGDGPDVPELLTTPLGAYGRPQPPSRRDVVVRGATLWTGGPQGIVEDAVLWVRDGRVAYAGPAAGAPETPGAEEIEAAGKHVTPGLIDCHSHTGVSGPVNEVGQRVTAEVRVQDVIDPDDVNWYRQLAGGLTAANQLHGSANAIGGQNSVVKLRWGVEHPDGMRLDGAPEGIKFALGENPKRVAANTGRRDEYPQTRMGVEALIRERLSAARDYADAWGRYEALAADDRQGVRPPRRDLELEALAEILRGERLVHAHSYRQDEILMLCRVARDFGFRIGTFQHVLEGYKVAEAIREAALGASTFADWWAYKFEVVDAIPSNAALMTDVGVNVSINSDSNEHARRLNTEAAKAVKYGGLEPHAALQLVTLNPAIQLGVADRVGSLEEGKDGDFAIWSGDPLSYRTRCESTWIEGRPYFTLEDHARLEREAELERGRILQKLLAEGAPEPRTESAAESGGEEVEDTTDEPDLRGVCGCAHL